MRFILTFLTLLITAQFSLSSLIRHERAECRQDCKPPSLSLFREITPRLSTLSYTDEDVLDALANPTKKTKFDNLEPHYEIYILPSNNQKNKWEEVFCKGKLDLQGDITDTKGKIYKFSKAILFKNGRKLQIATEEVDKSSYKFDGEFYEKPIFDNGIYVDFVGTVKFFEKGKMTMEKELKFARWTLH